MYNKVLFIVIFSLFLVGCERGMSSETASHAECITGVYTGVADFQRAKLGGDLYKLEVSRSSNDIILLMTDEASQQQFCTIYENPSFSEIDTNEYNIVSDNVQHFGQIIDSTGFNSLTLAYTQEEEMEEASSAGEILEEVAPTTCYLSSAQIYRPPSLGGFLENLFGSDDTPSLSGIEKSEEAPGNFSALQNICNSLEEVRNEEEEATEEATEDPAVAPVTQPTTGRMA